MTQNYVADRPKAHIEQCTLHRRRGRKKSPANYGDPGCTEARLGSAGWLRIRNRPQFPKNRSLFCRAGNSASKLLKISVILAGTGLRNTRTTRNSLFFP